MHFLFKYYLISSLVIFMISMVPSYMPKAVIKTLFRKYDAAVKGKDSVQFAAFVFITLMGSFVPFFRFFQVSSIFWMIYDGVLFLKRRKSTLGLASVNDESFDDVMQLTEIIASEAKERMSEIGAKSASVIVRKDLREAYIKYSRLDMDELPKKKVQSLLEQNKNENCVCFVFDSIKREVAKNA